MVIIGFHFGSSDIQSVLFESFRAFRLPFWLMCLFVHLCVLSGLSTPGHHKIPKGVFFWIPKPRHEAFGCWGRGGKGGDQDILRGDQQNLREDPEIIGGKYVGAG